MVATETVTFSDGSVVKNPPAKAGGTGSIPGFGRSSRVGSSSPLVFLPGKSHGQRSLAGYNLWGHKELDTTEHACRHSCQR